MNVLFLTHSFPRSEGDAAGSFILRLAVALRGEDVNVRVVAPASSGYPSSEEIEGVSVERFRYAPRRYEKLAYTGNMASDVASSWTAKFALVGFLGSDFVHAVRARRSFEPEIVHAHWWFPNGVVGTWVGGPRAHSSRHDSPRYRCPAGSHRGCSQASLRARAQALGRCHHGLTLAQGRDGSAGARRSSDGRTDAGGHRSVRARRLARWATASLRRPAHAAEGTRAPAPRAGVDEDAGVSSTSLAMGQIAHHSSSWRNNSGSRHVFAGMGSSPNPSFRRSTSVRLPSSFRRSTKDSVSSRSRRCFARRRSSRSIPADFAT